MLLRIHESTQAKITTFNMILWPPLHTMIKHAELRIYHTEWAEHKIKARGALKTVKDGMEMEKNVYLHTSNV